MSDETTPHPRFRVRLPGDRVALVPLDVLEGFVSEGGEGAFPAAPAPGEERDVVAHSLSVDEGTGESDWHTDWEEGECTVTDEAGQMQTRIAWHRHPFGTEYAELYSA